MDAHSRPIDERIEWLLELARRHSCEFCSSEASLARARYLARHPTAIAAMKCMDGRINLSVATQTPVGIIQPFRNLGGMFDLGWPHLGEVLAGYVHRMVMVGRRVLVLITYHFSRGSARRGCAGFHFDTQAAFAHTHAIKRQVEHTFGAGHATVFPLVCGFETDEDALILHGTDGERLDLSTIAPGDEAALAPRLTALLPDMPAQVREDLLPLLDGNLAHIAAVRKASRTLDIEHREWMICLGRGFDFLHTPNLALIVGPYSPDPVSYTHLDVYKRQVLRNAGTASALAVSLATSSTLNRPTFVSVTTTQGSCTASATPRCTLGNLAPGASATIRWVVRSRSTGSFTTQAAATTTGQETSTGNNTASQTTVVTRR